MAGRIQLRRGTAANWTSANPTLAAGEVGVETDTGYAKVGDGSTAWTSLGYIDARAAALLTAHLADTSDAHDASAISFSATGNIAATDVQAALDELDTEKIAAAVLTTDGDMLTRAGGIPARSTRAALAADAAFQGRYGPQATRTVSTLTLPLSLGAIPLSPPASGATVDYMYVDYVSGLAGNDGLTTGTPVQYLETALSKSTKPTVVMFVKAPRGANAYRRIWAPNSTKTVWLVPWPGDTEWAFWPSKRITSGWTSLGSGIYSQTISLSDPGGVTVTTLLDANSNETKLLRNTGTPTTPAAGEYGYTGGVLYVKLPGSVDPGTHTIEAAHWNYSVAWQGTGTLYITNCTFRYAGTSGGVMNGGSAAGGATGSTMICIDCEAAYNANTGFTANVAPLLTICIRCNSYCNGQLGTLNGDGFAPVTDVGVTSTYIAYECHGAWNIDEGISPHGNATLYVFGGRYSYNGSGGLAAIANTNTYVYGTKFDHNHRTPVAGEATIGAYDQAVIELYDCEVNNNGMRDVVAASTASIKQQNCRAWANNGVTVAALVN